MINTNIEKGSSVTICYLVVFVASGVLFIASCAPGVVWQDSGLIQYRALQNDIEGRLGLALSHPLYYIIVSIARFIPFSDFAYRINIINAIISAIAVANLYLLIRLWLGDTFAAWLGAASLGLSHTFWQHAAMPETYNLAAVLLLLEIICLLQYAKYSRSIYLYLLAFINGLAIANHNLAGLSLACYIVLVSGLLVFRKVKLRVLPVMMLLWIIGAAPYEFLIIKNIISSNDVRATLLSAVFGAKWQSNVLNTSISLSMVKENILYILLNFPSPIILLPIIGMWYIRIVSPARWFTFIILSLLLVYFIFPFRYNVADRYAFFIPFYCIVSILIAVGSYKYLIKNHGAAGYVFSIFVLMTIPAYMVVPYVAEGLEIRIGSGRVISYRNDDTFFLQPWRTGNNGAERFAREALAVVKSPAIIYADATTAGPLLYMRKAYQIRSDEDIKIISSIGNTDDSIQLTGQTVGTLLQGNNLYVVSPSAGYCPDFLLGRYDFKPAGVLWYVVKK
jgi:hypothetical protein